MNRNKKSWFMLVFLLALPGTVFSRTDAGHHEWGEEIVCVGGDALDNADLQVEYTPREEILHLAIETGSSDNEKENLVRSFSAHFKKGSFRKMLADGRIDVVLSSDKHPLTAFGGETSYAALIDLTKGNNGDLHGYLALEGSVYGVTCPKDQNHYFAFKF